MPVFLTSTYFKIKELKTRVKVVQGSQSAGKNIAIETLLFESALISKKLITIMTDTYDNLKDGSISDYRNIFNWAGMDFESHYNKQDKELKFENGSIIQFRYISDTKKHSGKSKRRDELYINETNKIGWEVAASYIGRTHGNVYLDLNPERETWVHTQIPKLVDQHGNKISSKVVVTFKDNEKCPQSEIDYIESRKDNTEWYRVFGLGLTGTYSDRQIYSYKMIDKIPKEAKRIPSGLDFGVSPDPTILIDLWIEKSNIYINEVFCENNLMMEKIKGAERMSVVDRLKEVKQKKGRMIIADSAGKTTITDMRKHGYNVLGVKKGSIIEGISEVRGYTLFVTSSSINVRKGIEEWFFKIDADGKIIPEPDGHEPDGLAALRYVVRMKGKYWN